MLRLIGALYDTGPNGLWVFLAGTVLLGGAAAFASGRAIAETWRPMWHLAPYMLLLAAGVRFVQFAVLAAPLLSPTNFLIDVAFLGAVATFGYRRKRQRQMVIQYGWTGEQGAAP